MSDINKSADVSTQESEKCQSGTAEDASAVKTYSMDEVAKRWGCTIGDVKSDINSGLPMYKKANGKWRIKEADLVMWEEMIQTKRSKKEEEAKKIKRNNLITYIIGGIILVVIGSIVLFTGTSF